MDETNQNRKTKIPQTANTKAKGQEITQEEIDNISIRKYKKKIKQPPLKWIVIILLVIAMVSGILALNIASGGKIFNTFFDKKVVFQAQLVGETKIHFIDVGQADCILIEQSGHYALIDAGDGEAGDKILDYLKKMSVTKLDYFIMSHPHSDHIGSMRRVMNNIKIDTIILPDFSKGIVPTTSIFKNVLKEIKKLEIPTVTAVQGDKYTLGDGKIEIIASGANKPKNVNDTSIVLMLEASGIKFLTAGDAEKMTERDVLKSGADISADILKVSHHGSVTSSTDAFIKAVSPKVAVISCGYENQFGHPHAKTLKTLRKYDIPFWSTAYAGDVVVCIDDQNIIVVKSTDME